MNRLLTGILGGAFIIITGVGSYELEKLLLISQGLSNALIDTYIPVISMSITFGLLSVFEIINYVGFFEVNHR